MKHDYSVTRLYISVNQWTNVFHLQARSAQVPLIMSGKSMATSSSNYFNVAKALAVNSKDQTCWQQLAQQAKAVSDAMRRLITAIK